MHSCKTAGNGWAPISASPTSARSVSKRRALGEFLLGPLQLEEQADLTPQAAEHAKQRFIRRQNIPVEKFNDAEDLLPERHGESKRSAESLLGGERPAGQMRVRAHVGDPAGCTAPPDGTGQFLAQRQRPAATGRFKISRVGCGRRPNIDTAQDVFVSVHFPKDADWPFQFLAEGLQNPFAGLGLRGRFGQHLRDGLLEGQMLFGHGDFTALHVPAFDSTP